MDVSKFDRQYRYCQFAVLAAVALVFGVMGLVGCGATREDPVVDNTSAPETVSHINQSVHALVRDKQFQTKIAKQFWAAQAVVEERRRECEVCQKKLQRYGVIPGCSVGLEATLASVRRLLVIQAARRNYPNKEAWLDLVMSTFRSACHMAELEEGLK